MNNSIIKFHHKKNIKYESNKDVVFKEELSPLSKGLIQFPIDKLNSFDLI